VGFDVLTTCQPSTVLCSRERLPAAAAQPAKVRQSCSATDTYVHNILRWLALSPNPLNNMLVASSVKNLSV
jgi:hypothetical protein